MPRQYTICEHAYTCVAGKHIVFLDLERDKYLCLDLEATATLLPHLRGRSFLFEDSLFSAGATWAGVAPILAELEQRNLGCAAAARPGGSVRRTGPPPHPLHLGNHRR